jgi:hypothetical protein
MLLRDDPTLQANKNAPRDFLNITVGVAWQLTLVTIPLYLLIRDLRGVLISLAVLVASIIFLKKFWYDSLESGEGLAHGTAAFAEAQPAESD